MPSQMGFEGLLEAIPDALVGVDTSGVIQFVNHHTESLFLYQRADLIGASLEKLVPESLRQVHAAHREAYSSAPRTRPMGTGLTLSGRRADGTEFPVGISLSFSGHGDDMVMIAAVRDMTDREKAAQEHELTEQRMAFEVAQRTAAIAENADDAQREAAGLTRSMIEASLDSMVSISPEDTIIDANEATVRLTGVPRDKLIGTSFSDYFTDAAKAERIHQKVFTEGRAVDYPLTLRHHDGTLTEVLYNASAYRDAHGTVLGVFATARDVTKRVHALREAAHQQALELDRLAELERFHRLTVGRELKMIELKKEIEYLRKFGRTEGGE